MNAGFHRLLGLALLAATPAFAAKPTPPPSVQLRHMIDTTLTKIGTISNPKQPPFDRTALSTAQADFSAMAQTAPPAQQPMYQAAQTVVANLVGAVEEHEKAVADFRYSKNLHGPQDNKDAKVADWQRGWDAGAAARADNAKQKMENQASRKALLDKEQFLSNGAINSWTERVAQIHDIVEQSFTAELVAEKQLAMLTPPAPLPPPPKPAPKPTREISAAEKYSPVGAWQTVIPKHRAPTLNEDNTVVSSKHTGTWNWTDQSKGALCIVWNDGLRADLNFSPDGRTMTGTVSNGGQESFIRSTGAAPAASTALPPTAPKPPPSQPSAPQQSSPIGTWKAERGPSLTLKEDGTAARGNVTGTWKWTDQGKGALSISWANGVTSDLTFPANGGAMTGKNSKGTELNFTRGN